MSTIKILNPTRRDRASYANDNPDQDLYEHQTVTLDLRRGLLYTDATYRIYADTQTQDEYNGIVRPYPIAPSRMAEMRALLKRLAPLAQRVHDGATLEYSDQGDLAATLNDDARAADVELEAACRAVPCSYSGFDFCEGETLEGRY